MWSRLVAKPSAKRRDLQACYLWKDACPVLQRSRQSVIRAGREIVGHQFLIASPVRARVVQFSLGPPSAREDDSEVYGQAWIGQDTVEVQNQKVPAPFRVLGAQDSEVKTKQVVSTVHSVPSPPPCSRQAESLESKQYGY